MDNSSFINIIKRHKKLIAFLFISMLTIFLLSKYSFMNIEIPEQSGNFTYTIVNQANQSKTEIKTNSNKLKRLLPRGNYEVLVTKDSSSSFAVTKTGGFLGNTDLRLNLSPEKSRQFVGDNPKPCMLLTNQLYSSECGERLSSLTSHVPATTFQPGYTIDVRLPLNGVDEGLVQLGDEIYFLVQTISEESDSGTHGLYRFSDGQLVGQPIILTELDKGSTYSTIRYRDGFLVYTSDFSDIKYYRNPGEKPTDVTLDKPKQRNLSPSVMSAGNGAILAVYTDAKAENVRDAGDTPKDTQNEIIVKSERLSKSIRLSGLPVADTSLCGSSLLCALEGDNLMVYDISGEKQRFLYKITGVNKIVSSGDDLMIFRNGEIISLDAGNRSGFIDYTLGAYRSCGSQFQNGNYVLCLLSPTSQKSALLIDRMVKNTDSIDKKIAQVAELPEVDTVSIYKSLIYISPNLGPLSYREDIRGYGYDPNTQKRVNDKINQEIDKIGIDRNKYQVINPLE